MQQGRELLDLALVLQLVEAREHGAEALHEDHPGVAQFTGQSIWLHFLGRVRPGQTPSSLAATMISRLHEDHPGIAQSTGQSIWLHFLGRVGPGH